MHSARLLLVSLMLPLMAQTAERPEAPTTPPRTPVDLRPEFERRGLARRQQGERPTCSVFTVTTAIEFALARRDGQCPRLSVEFLNWAGNDAAGGAADGGFFSDLWRGFERHGICAEDALPYRAAFEATPSPGASALADAKARRRPGLRLHWIKEWDVNTGLTDAHLAGIERSLADGWPVCGGFRWPRNAKWTADVLQMCPADAVYDGHSVLLVGCRQDAAQPGGGVFLFRNTAGDGRDGAMPYDYARAYMNDAAWIDFERATGR